MRQDLANAQATATALDIQKTSLDTAYANYSRDSTAIGATYANDLAEIQQYKKESIQRRKDNRDARIEMQQGFYNEVARLS